MKIRIAALLALISICACAESQTMTSPNGNVKVELGDGEKLTYALSVNGEKSFLSGELGLDFEDQAWPEKLEIVAVLREKIDEKWQQPIGIQKEYHDLCNQYTVKLKADFPKREVGLVFRLYDEGLAFRYTVTPKDPEEEYVVTKDKTDYLFDKDYECWYAPYGFRTSQEHESVKATLCTIPKGTISG